MIRQNWREVVMPKGTYKEARPWGGFSKFAGDEKCTVKVLRVGPGHKLSVQRHEKRDELWVGIERGHNHAVAYVTYPGDEPEVIPMRDLNEVWIPRGAVHSLENRGPETVYVLEISFGEFDEKDIERLEDNYGRA
jgi:mannose-1-phosphate guanylyltransferase/mannose-6-phosphate isomerase